MSIGRLGALDLDLAAALHRAAFEPLGERPWTRQEMAELLASPGVAGFRHGQEGMALSRLAGGEAELLTLAVAPDRRREGIGRALLDAVVVHARTAGAQHLFLEVGIDNPPACALYAASGFHEVGRRPGYYRRGERAPADASVMRLDLC